MQANLNELIWVECSAPTLVQGVRGGYRPRNAIRGGNGSFICVEPAKIYLKVTTFDMKTVESDDIIKLLRQATGWVKITRNRVNMLREFMENSEFEVENGEIVNIEALLNDFAYLYA